MKPPKSRLTWILFTILSVFYLTVLYTQGLLRSNPLAFFANILGPAIGIYVFAEIIARRWYKHKGNERRTEK